MDRKQTNQNNQVQFKQDDCLAAIVKNNSLVNVYLRSGIKLQGYISAFDNYVIFLTVSDRQGSANTQMLYKQAIATILLCAE